ncbi:MAG: ThuA domain-containing protein [Kiritimatiellae bacterium]|nr:ThuA domain-containing protein [Kiritimatiellia bacterium]
MDCVKGALAGLLSAAAVCEAAAAGKIDFVDSDNLETIVSEWEGVKPVAPRRVLFFNEIFGYDHTSGRSYGEWTFRRAGELKGTWQIEQVKDAKLLADPGFIGKFDAIVLLNSTLLSESVAPGLTRALTDYVVKQGGGIALIHAGLDAFKDSDELLSLFGGFFKGHPWHSQGTWRFINEQPANPINASFRDEKASFSRIDEIYQFPAFFDRKRCDVLISMDMSDSSTKAAETWWEKRFGPGATREDHDYAVSWTREPGKGRIFYTSFGHDRQAFLDRTRLYHMFAGLQFALGDLPVKSGRKYAADVPEQRFDWANGPWRVRMAGEVAAAKGKRLKMVTVGDSIWMLWRFSSEGRVQGGKEAWNRYFGKYETLNLGMSGDRTEHVLWRITAGRDADGWTADNIFVTCGCNNSWQKKPDGTGFDTPEDAAKGMKKIVETLKEKHPESKIFIVGMLPMDSRREWGGAYNSIIKTFADGDRVAYRDYGAEALAGADGRQDRALFSGDGVHPNPAGYEKLAAAMAKDVK